MEEYNDSACSEYACDMRYAVIKAALIMSDLSL